MITRGPQLAQAAAAGADLRLSSWPACATGEPATPPSFGALKSEEV